MKYLGIDYGTKRVGIAVAERGGMAFPRVVLQNDGSLVDEIAKLVEREGISKIVLGESRDFSGKENPVMKHIHEFKEKITEALHIPVILFPEVLSSREAARIQGDNDMNDASAAAIVLQSYLDRMQMEERLEEDNVL